MISLQLSAILPHYNASHLWENWSALMTFYWETQTEQAKNGLWINSGLVYR